MATTGTATNGTAPRIEPRFPGEVWVLVAAAFVIAVGFGLVAPVLPTFAASFHVGVAAATFIVSSFALVRLAFAPASGRLVNRFGERPIYLVGLLIVAITTGACAFATDYWQLLALRSAAGVGSTMFTVSGVGLLIRLTPPPLRGRASGLWATSFLLGSITGPVLGSGLGEISLRAPFLVYGATLLLAATIVWFFLRRSTLAAPPDGTDGPAMTIGTALRHPTYRAALVSGFANGWVVFGVRVAVMPLFVANVLHRGSGLAGISLAVFAAGDAAVLMLAGRVADARGRKPLVLVGLVVLGGGTAALGLSEEVWLFLAASLVAGIGAGLLNPPQNAALADIVGAKGRGGPALAGFQMATDVGAILGPLAAGVVADHFSYGTAFGLTAIVAALAFLAWLPAPETLPQGSTDHAAKDVALDCGRLEECGDLPTGRRLPTNDAARATQANRTARRQGCREGTARS
ncbi:MFS transporter [Longimycelium tulufanense]|uniref:MFS transporter n=1 Tax=Longimycelium tulufanense TaxID=907463 RepID=A0A8J3C6L7_9PSEU|nr:MFS transporter [Longimycelium tulufanense]GGM41836.1 MFS transporter [Longimycelium tulufanense]